MHIDKSYSFAIGLILVVASYSFYHVQEHVYEVKTFFAFII